MPLSEQARKNQLKYIQQYDKEHYYRLLVKFRHDTDKDILDFMEQCGKRKGTILKEALRFYIKHNSD